MKNGKSKPGPKPRTAMKSRSMSFEVELLNAAEAMIRKHPLKPTLPTIINLALRRYLEAEGAIEKEP